MKKALSCLFVLCLLLGAVYSGMPVLAEKADAGRKTTVIIRTEDAGYLKSDAAGKSPEAVKQKAARTQNVIQAINKNVCPLEAEYTYTHIFNGFAAEVKKGDIEKIRNTKGVAAVYETGGAKPVIKKMPAGTDISSGSMIGLDEARAMGYDGTGTAVAVIDGGFDINSEVMRLTDNSTAKISKEKVASVLANNKMNCEGFSADDLYHTAKIPFAFDYEDKDADVRGREPADGNHGNHVSGIAAGNSDRLAGVAPEAQLLLFKICIWEDEPFLANMLAAVDDAAKFDIAAINLSVGIALENPADPAYELLREVFMNARSSGILVCTAAGNDSVRGYNTINLPDNGTDGIPNTFEGATSVASVDNTALSAKTGTEPKKIIYDGDKFVSVENYSTVIPFPKETVTLVPMGKNGTDEDLTGKCALIYREDSDFKKVIEQIRESDAVAIILDYNSFDKIFYGYDDELEDLVYSILDRVALLIVDTLDAYRLYHAKSREIRVEFTEGYYAEPADEIWVSEYSSRGIMDDGSMAVDIAAPGGIIYSSVQGNNYEMMDGTSMASPHICGTGALLDQHFTNKGITVQGKDKSDLMESIIMSTADPVPQGDAFTSVRDAGAGLVNLSRALSTNAILLGGGNRSALDLGDRLGREFDVSFTVKNFSAETVIYDTVSLVVDSDEYETERMFNSETGEYDEVFYTTGFEIPLGFTMQTDTGTITLAPGESREITVSVAIDEEDFGRYEEVFTNGFFIDGYVFLTDSTGANTALNMPFLGFAGDWDAVPALEENNYSFGNEYTVIRNLRELRCVLTDANGNRVAEESIKDLNVYSWFNIYSIAAKFKDVPDGTYTVTVYAVPFAARTDEGQEYSLGEIVIDRTPPEIVKVSKKRNIDGSGTVTVTMKNDDIDYFEISGGSLFNRSFKDYYPVDGYDSIDKNGNYVYILSEESLPLGLYTVMAVDTAGQTDINGIVTPLVKIINFFEEVIEIFRYTFREFELI